MAITQAADFIAENEALLALVRERPDEDFSRPTQFRDWTIDDVIGHLHFWNRAAELALLDPQAFSEFARHLQSTLAHESLRGREKRSLDGLRGRSLLESWRTGGMSLGERFAAADPQQRLPWVGPPMSALSCITARLMETWAHGQALYDLLGVTRRDTDRLRNIAQLGVNTFAWSFRNRGLVVPATVPRVTLQAPSGQSWDWNADNTEDCVSGHATEFCQVVTQTRNLADTKLSIAGPTATRWMSIAQCFAGPPADPPAAGTRYRQ